MSEIQTNKKTFKGKVVSTSMNKTIVVLVERYTKHKLYNKRFIKSKKFKVHDEKEIAKLGDIVKFVECRPISKTKKFRLLEVKP